MNKLALAAVLVGSAIASAGPKEQSKELVAKAQTAFASGRYEDALTDLQAAYKLTPQPDLIYAIGQANSKLGRCGRRQARIRDVPQDQQGPGGREDRRGGDRGVQAQGCGGRDRADATAGPARQRAAAHRGHAAARARAAAAAAAHDDHHDHGHRVAAGRAAARGPRDRAASRVVQEPARRRADRRWRRCGGGRPRRLQLGDLRPRPGGEGADARRLQPARQQRARRAHRRWSLLRRRRAVRRSSAVSCSCRAGRGESAPPPVAVTPTRAGGVVTWQTRF